MATDVERLVVSLEASITKYERAMNKALQVSNKNMRDIERRTDQAMGRVESRMSRMGKNLNASFVAVRGGMVGAFAAAAAVRGAQQLIDASIRVENSLKVAGLAGEELDRVYDSLYDSAQRNAAPIESLVELYSRASLVQNELGVSTEELTKFTDNVAVALRVAGTDAQSASGALLQLSQALGSGTVRAEEFNSIQEGALPVLQAVAAGIEEAGGSVAKLRQLVIDGKVSSEAFFRGFEAGSVILTEKVANAEMTVSQQFVRLMNVLTDTAGKFNEVTGAGDGMGAVIAQIASEIEAFGGWIEDSKDSIQWLLDVLHQIDQFGGGPSMFSVRAIGERMDEMSDQFEGAAAEIEFFNSRVEEATRLALDHVNVMLRSRDLDMYPPELKAQLEGLKSDLENGTLEAADALSALNALGDVNPNLAPLLAGLNDVISTLQSVQANAAAAMEAAALAAAVPGTPGSRGRPGKEPGQSPNGAPVPPPRPAGLGIAPDQITLADYPITGGDGSGGGGRGGGSSQADAYQRALDQQRERLRMLEMETALQQTLNPLVNDYGFAVERLRTQMELENAAAEAGLELTPERRAEIEQLAEGYATATANAQRLADAQDKVREAAEAMGEAGRQALDTIVQGFIDGQSAGEIFGQVLSQLGSALLNMGLSSIGQSFGIPGFANGTLNAPGGMALVGEQGPELVNLPKGAQVIPNYRTKQMLGGSGAPAITFAPVIDARGADVAAVARLEQVVARQQAEFDVRVQRIVRSRGKKWID